MRVLFVAALLVTPSAALAQNTAPPIPGLISPDGTSPVCTWQPTIVLENVDDPDGDALSYFVQVDSDPCFCTPRSQSSGPLDQGDTETSWLVPRPFGDESSDPLTVYVGRRTDDGTESSEFEVSQFDVDPACADLGPTDEDDPDAGGCAMTPSGQPDARPMLATLAFVALVTSRRRRPSR